MLYKLILSYINIKIEDINTKMVILATEGPTWYRLTGWRFPCGIVIAFRDSMLEFPNAMAIPYRPKKKLKKKKPTLTKRRAI